MDGYDIFKKDVYNLTQIDLNAYKEKQMKRRIDTLINHHKIDNYKGFVELLKKDKNFLEEFISYLTINVSEFYRNPDQWKILEKDIFPILINRFGKKLKIWSAACSTGDEPYSLVMNLSKYVDLKDIKIDATDIDKQILAAAKTGVYSNKSIEEVPNEYKNKYFTKVSDSSVKINDEIKNCVDFKEHNLLKDPYGTGYDLIVCRNVLIYFTEEAKDEIFKKFYDSLAPGGILFLGATEQIMNYKQLGFERRSSFFFEK